MTDSIKAVFDVYCEITHFQPKLAIHERAIAEYLQAGYDQNDLRCVLLFLQRENRRGDRTYSLRLDKLLDFEFRHFDSLLCEARAKERNRPKPPSNSQRVVEQFRHTKTVTEQPVARSVKDVLREIVK